MREKDCERDIVKEKDMLDWSEVGLIKSEQMNITSIKQATLEPEWNELIEL